MSGHFLPLRQVREDVIGIGVEAESSGRCIKLSVTSVGITERN